MANTYTLISSVTVGSGGAADIEFTSIPATYTDLLVKYSIRDNNAQVYTAMTIQFNNSGGTAYSYRMLEGSGSSTRSTNQSSLDKTYGVFTANGANATANTFSNGEFYIPNYAGSTHKSISWDAVTENNGTEAYATLNASLWANTSAITSVKLACSGTIQEYSTAYLYGISNV
jgi:hypothetical protein